MTVTVPCLTTTGSSSVISSCVAAVSPSALSRVNIAALLSS